MLLSYLGMLAINTKNKIGDHFRIWTCDIIWSMYPTEGGVQLAVNIDQHANCIHK